MTATEQLLAETVTYAFALGQAYELGHFDGDTIVKTLNDLAKTVAEMVDQ